MQEDNRDHESYALKLTWTDNVWIEEVIDQGFWELLYGNFYFIYIYMELSTKRNVLEIAGLFSWNLYIPFETVFNFGSSLKVVRDFKWFQI